ncbi:DUF7552 domain-containing protein [Halorussus marinus]|uniref:DUF7552 domain-containing protein n=1 Tax=Halorussus marinus TaxID=2505976 RepID=UPI00106DDD3A|nr:hypothetical protein [Halorussus marinus]
MADRLETLHRRIDALTDPDGEYAVVCPLSGKRPVPVRDASFGTPDDAEAAADLVIDYRELLRSVDPHLEHVPIVAGEVGADPLALADSDRGSARSRTVVLSGEGDGEWLTVDGAPVVEVRRDGEPLDDASVSRQLRSGL